MIGERHIPLRLAGGEYASLKENEEIKYFNNQFIVDI